MKRMITTLALAAAMLLATATAALAGDPTCFNQFDSGWENHSTHILNDYVADGSIAGGAPAHFGNESGFGPGASFCLDQAQAGVVRP